YGGSTKLSTLVQGFPFHYEQRRGPVRKDHILAGAPEAREIAKKTRYFSSRAAASSRASAAALPDARPSASRRSARSRKHSSAMLSAASTATRRESTAPALRLTSCIWAST